MLASGFCTPESLPVHMAINRRQVYPLFRFYAEDPKTCPWPPGGNKGYVRNRDVPYLSVTSSYVDDNISGL